MRSSRMRVRSSRLRVRSSLLRMRSSRLRMRSSRLRMRSSRWGWDLADWGWDLADWRWDLADWVWDLSDWGWDLADWGWGLIHIHYPKEVLKWIRKPYPEKRCHNIRYSVRMTNVALLITRPLCRILRWCPPFLWLTWSLDSPSLTWLSSRWALDFPLFKHAQDFKIVRISSFDKNPDA